MRKSGKNKSERIQSQKSDKRFVKWKGYDNSFDSWIDKKDIL